MTALLIAAGALLAAMLAMVLRASRKIGEAQARADYEAKERERSERMAREMLKERSREDVARDLDSGRF